MQMIWVLYLNRFNQTQVGDMAKMDWMTASGAEADRGSCGCIWLNG